MKKRSPIIEWFFRLLNTSLKIVKDDFITIKHFSEASENVVKSNTVLL